MGDHPRRSPRLQKRQSKRDQTTPKQKIRSKREPKTPNRQDKVVTPSAERNPDEILPRMSLQRVPVEIRQYQPVNAYSFIGDETLLKEKLTVSPKSKAEIQCSESKKLGIHVLEQQVYGIDIFTYKLLLSSMPKTGYSLQQKQDFIEQMILPELNSKAKQLTGQSLPRYSLKTVIESIRTSLDTQKKRSGKKKNNLYARKKAICTSLLKSIESGNEEDCVAYKKGLGVVCCNQSGFEKDEFIVQYFGEVYPPWRWSEKECGIKSLLTIDDPPEFYNIYLERPKGGIGGYDVVVVDSMHKSTYASRLNHSCDPNCESRVVAIDGQYQIGVFTLREILCGEELTMNYYSKTESELEAKSSICLCGSRLCVGTYLKLIGEADEESENIMKEEHLLTNRLHLLTEACESNIVSDEDRAVLKKSGFGNCVLAGLPPWLERYSAHLVKYINLEKEKLQEKLSEQSLNDNPSKKNKCKRKGKSISPDKEEKSPAEMPEIQSKSEGVQEQRLQNLALTLDKVKHVLRLVFGEVQMAPPILQKLHPDDMATAFTDGMELFGEVLHKQIAPHMNSKLLENIETKMQAQHMDPSTANQEIEDALVRLQHECRSLQCKDICDQLITYVYTQFFTKLLEHKSVTSPPLLISRRDMGTKYSSRLTEESVKYYKTYDKYYCLGQLLFWYTQDDDVIDKTLQVLPRGDQASGYVRKD